MAIEQYKQYQQQANRHSEQLATEFEFIINPSFPFLGALPDRAVYDASNEDQPFGFVEQNFHILKRQNTTGNYY